MKKIIYLLFFLAAFVTTQAQTNIPMTNGDCSTTAELSGSSPYVIPGYTIAQTSGTLTTASSGLIGGVLKIVGTVNGATQTGLTITTDKVDISAYPVDATFTFQCKLTCGIATSSAQPYNVVIAAYDETGTLISSSGLANPVLTLTKVQPNTNVTSQVTIGATAAMRANNGTLLTNTNNAKYIALQLVMGKMITNNLSFDNFTLTKLDVAPTTTTGTPSNADLSYVVDNGPSAESTFTVSGEGLGTDNIVLTPASNLEISLTSGSGFVANPSTLSLTPTSGTVSSTTIYTRLKSGITGIGAVSSSSARVTVFHQTAGSKLVQFTGAVNGISAGTITNSALSYDFGNGPSAEGSFTITASGLTNDLVVTPGSDLEISTTTGSGFQSTAITLPNTTTSQAIYSRLKAGLGFGTYNGAGTAVEVSSTGFTGASKQFTGSVGLTSSTIADGVELNINQAATSANMTVSPLGKVTLTDNTTLATSTITLQSNEGGTATFVDLNSTTPQTVTGTVQQYLTAERNWYSGSPIAAATAANLNLGTSVQTYSEATKSWTILDGADALAVGKGYVSVASVGAGTTGTVSFSGTLNSGTVAVPVTRTESGTKIGFNLVANPYPSYLDWSLVTADASNANIGTTMWFRTKTAGGAYTFSAYNSLGGIAAANGATTTISNLIPPMQAFWVRVNSGTSSTDLTFKNSMRAHKDVSGNTFKAPKAITQQLLRLQVSDETLTDETIVYANPNASDAFDTFDSPKYFETESSLKPEIYTQVGSELLVINGYSSIPYDVEIPLGFVAKKAGTYGISRTEMTNFEDGTRIVLKDKLNGGSETELSEGVVYQFNSEVSPASANRFSLTFRAPGAITSTFNALNQQVQVLVNASNQMMVVAPTKSNYTVYNVFGQKLNEGVITNSNILTPSYAPGIYVVKVAGNGVNYTTKVNIQ